MQVRLINLSGGTFVRRATALSLIELLVVAIIVLAGIVLLFLPRLSRSPPARRINCVNNLKQVGLAFQLWAGDNHGKFPMQVSVTNEGTLEFVPTGLVFPHFLVMSNELNIPLIVHCPADTERTNALNFTSDFNDWRLSYFVNVDADRANPEQLLCGDRNLTFGGVAARRGLLSLRTNAAAGWSRDLHREQGNVLLADGSVQQVNTARLQKAIARSGATNRLAIP